MYAKELLMVNNPWSCRLGLYQYPVLCNLTSTWQLFQLTCISNYWKKTVPLRDKFVVQNRFCQVNNDAQLPTPYFYQLHSFQCYKVFTEFLDEEFVIFGVTLLRRRPLENARMYCFPFVMLPLFSACSVSILSLLF